MALELTNKQFLPNDETKWVDAPNYDGVRFLIRPRYTMDYNLAQGKYREWLARMEAQTTEGYDIDLRVHDYDNRKLPLQAEILARHVVKDWEGVVVGGEDIPYSIDSCIELLTSNPDLYGLINDESQQFAYDLIEQANKTRKKR